MSSSPARPGAPQPCAAAPVGPQPPEPVPVAARWLAPGRLEITTPGGVTVYSVRPTRATDDGPIVGFELVEDGGADIYCYDITIDGPCGWMCSCPDFKAEGTAAAGSNVSSCPHIICLEALLGGVRDPTTCPAPDSLGESPPSPLAPTNDDGKALERRGD